MKKFLSVALTLSLTLSLVAMPASAENRDFATVTANQAQSWFYDQLSAQGKDIYTAMLTWFTDGGMKDGTGSLDLADIVGQNSIEAYLNGNRTLFNDFAAAKDAFDLEHPEAWYVDSAYLSFRVTSENDTYHAYIGPGRAENYYANRNETKESAAVKDAAVQRIVDEIVAGAGNYSSTAEKVKYVHGEITRRISYRFENECSENSAAYIRTTYALVTQEGVCEGYARSFQWVMNELGIPCVLIHGVQSSGVPEDHMWTAVQLDGNWYVVDPTWDDPVPLDKDGNIKKPTTPGVDGGEHETYLLAGQDITAQNWKPSGYVSTGMMEFTYPTIALRSYFTKEAANIDGLKVEADENSSMEGVTATRYTVSFKGMGVEAAAQSGYYFLVKMYDVNADGSVNMFDDWYYPIHMLYAINGLGSTGMGGNPYFHDAADGMTMVVSHAEYVEFAITTKAPPDWKTPMDLVRLGGYYDGNGADILAQSGLICNINGGYEAPPYVKNVSPLFNTSVYVGQNYTIHMEFTDPLYKPTQSDLDRALAGKEGDLKAVVGQDVKLDYTGTTYSWGVNQRLPHTFAQKPDPTNVTWFWDTSYCSEDHEHSFDNGCRASGLEYNFSASRMWADDSIQYEFFLTGLVGTKSNKAPGTWSYVFENISAYCSYRASAGIDWNLWGQPQLLDNPNDLDLGAMVTQGVSSDDQGNLAALRDQMHLDDQDMNGRLMLVVEDLSGSRSSTEELGAAIDSKTNINSSDVLARSLYEIDFARICKKTIVKTGQSLRLSVGFPAGFDASMAGITFKAYHFTRDENGNVISVEELPITVTQYGLVILCSSFSPFEIVALDSNQYGDTSLKNTVTLVNDGNGKVTSDGAAAVRGVDSIVSIPEGSSVTFTVEPADGYVLDTISFNGRSDIQVIGGEFTLSSRDLAGLENGNAILSVTFVPENGLTDQVGTVVTPTVCSHTYVTVDQAYVAATCTTNGRTEGKTCNTCGQVLSVSQVILATGHVDLATDDDMKIPTCTQAGHTGKVICSVCGETLDTDGTDIPALGHNYINGFCTRCNKRDHNYTPPTSSTPSGGGTSSGNTSSGHTSSRDSYTVSASHTGNGSIQFSSSPRAGERVTVTIMPDAGFVLESITVTGENGNWITVTKNSDGTYSFIMPECDVSVNAAFSPERVYDVSFTDVPSTAYYAAPVDWAIANDITAGTSAATFGPIEPCTRAQIMTFLWKAAGKPDVFGSGFSDVAANAYYAVPVAWAVRNGITAGTSATTFGPNDICTRAQAMTFLWKAAGNPTPSSSVSFFDVPSNAYYAQAVAWAVENGITAGVGDGLFGPDNTCTRAQIVTFLYATFGN